MQEHQKRRGSYTKTIPFKGEAIREGSVRSVQQSVAIGTAASILPKKDLHVKYKDTGEGGTFR